MQRPLNSNMQSTKKFYFWQRQLIVLLLFYWKTVEDFNIFRNKPISRKAVRSHFLRRQCSKGPLQSQNQDTHWLNVQFFRNTVIFQIGKMGEDQISRNWD